MFSKLNSLLRRDEGNDMIEYALLAAFMSTYSATVNAAPAYIVNDLYKRYVNPNAEEKVYVRMSYLSSIAVVLVGTAFGFFNLVSGIAMLVASVLAGLLWDGLGAAATFYAGAGFSLIALVMLVPGSRLRR